MYPALYVLLYNLCYTKRTARSIRAFTTGDTFSWALPGSWTNFNITARSSGDTDTHCSVSYCFGPLCLFFKITPEDRDYCFLCSFHILCLSCSAISICKKGYSQERLRPPNSLDFLSLKLTEKMQPETPSPFTVNPKSSKMASLLPSATPDIIPDHEISSSVYYCRDVVPHFLFWKQGQTGSKFLQWHGGETPQPSGHHPQVDRWLYLLLPRERVCDTYLVSWFGDSPTTDSHFILRMKSKLKVALQMNSNGFPPVLHY